MVLVSIAGTLLSGGGFINGLVQTYRDIRSWDEKDIEVTSAWVEVAIEKAVLSGPISDYNWSRESELPVMELKEEAEAVVVINAEKRIVYRVFRGRPTDIGGRLMLARRIAKKD